MSSPDYIAIFLNQQGDWKREEFMISNSLHWLIQVLKNTFWNVQIWKSLSKVIKDFYKLGLSWAKIELGLSHSWVSWELNLKFVCGVVGFFFTNTNIYYNLLSRDVGTHSAFFVTATVLTLTFLTDFFISSPPYGPSHLTFSTTSQVLSSHLSSPPAYTY